MMIDCFKCGKMINFKASDITRGWLWRNDFDSARFVEEIGRSNAEKALKLIAEGGVANRSDFSLEICNCPQCKELYQKLYFRIKTGEEFFEPDYSCEKCRHPLEPIFSFSKWPCPSCGKLGLNWCYEFPGDNRTVPSREARGL